MRTREQRREEVLRIKVSTRVPYLTPRDRGLIKIGQGVKLTKREEEAVDRLLIEAASK